MVYRYGYEYGCGGAVDGAVNKGLKIWECKFRRVFFPSCFQAFCQCLSQCLRSNICDTNF